jgi:hypothetical protein
VILAMVFRWLECGEMRGKRGRGAITFVDGEWYASFFGFIFVPGFS